MLNYPEIIKKLNLRQKLALLTDVKSLSDPEIVRAGVPAVVTATLEELNAGSSLPSFAQTARSWDPDLIAAVSEELASEGSAQGVDLLATPDIKSAVTPYAVRLSEDPLVCGELGASILRGIRAAGVGSCLSGFSLQNEDAEYLDVKEDPAAVAKFYDLPFKLAQSEGKADAVSTSLSRPAGDYADVNRRFLGRAMKSGSFLLCENVPSDADLGYLLKGPVCMGGAVLPLDTAIGRYERFLRLIEEGSATRRELENAVEKGNAIAESAIDEAADRVVGFAYAVAQKEKTGAERREDLRRRAAEESVVLLKNSGVLPLSSETNVAVIGALATEGEETFVKRFARNVGLDFPLRFAGQAEGYSLSAERSEELIPEAVRLAEESDVVLLFLGLGDARESEVPLVKSVALPANQLALADALVRTGKKIVAVIAGDYPVDMNFDRKLHAVLLAPLSGTECFDALTDILTGKCNPSGKLTRTYYDNTDELFLALKNYKDAGRNRVGEFAGYRRYDTAGVLPRYPFGHGLGYAPFAYSGLETNATGLRLIVTNRGSCAGKEIVQVYAGKKGVRPKKELIAFAKVELQAGESKAVVIPLPEERFSYYDPATRSYQRDGGLYTLYVGASVRDVRLKTVFSVEGGCRPEKEESLADYFQNESNVMYGGYSLKDARARAIRNRKEHRAMRLVASVFLILCALCDLLLIAAGAAGLELGEGYAGGLFFVNLLLVTAIVALICERATRGKGATALLPADADKPEGAETGKSDDLERYFLKALEEKEEENAPEQEGTREDFFDETLTFARARDELSAFASDHGIALSADSARALVAAIASSRCLILRGPIKPLVLLTSLLAEYFGSRFFMDDAEGYREPSDLFYKEGEHGVRVRSDFSLALRSAEELKPYLHFAVLNHVRLSALGNFFAPVLERLKNPRGGQILEADGFGGERYPIPPNLRFVLILSEGQRPEDLPFAAADAGCLLSPEIALCPPREEKRLVSPLGFFQLSELNRRAKLTLEIDEPLWKKVDRLEQATAARAAYRIDNQLWLAVENYAAVYLACGGEPSDALDSAVAGKLLARTAALWRATKGDLPAALSEIFGEENVPRCVRILKNARREEEE